MYSVTTKSKSFIAGLRSETTKVTYASVVKKAFGAEPKFWDDMSPDQDGDRAIASNSLRGLRSQSCDVGDNFLINPPCLLHQKSPPNRPMSAWVDRLMQRKHSAIQFAPTQADK